MKPILRRRVLRAAQRALLPCGLLALAGCAHVGMGFGVPMGPLSVGVGVGSGGVSAGVGAGAGPLGVGVGVNSRGQVTGGAGVGTSVPIGSGPARAGVGVGTGGVLYDPQGAPVQPAPGTVTPAVVAPRGAMP
ncbi:hypothetical protein WG922_02235 [Ramlibacter sp. AN1015]|uniref:hypothetical protein n=1 Tax=Ramlibacter sp. AN1015 TaxID=3133428 RepID=UPI0030C353AB